MQTILPNEYCKDLVFEKICSLDYYNKTLYIPDWRKDAPRTLIVATQTDKQDIMDLI